mmetsp:Transcript_35017/g.84739  ORF Transcript_35017/g.84739 Transcript_35017/m.84739 type:complete len:412 (-) Transcript_35017:202-1437(-)
MVSIIAAAAAATGSSSYVCAQSLSWSRRILLVLLSPFALVVVYLMTNESVDIDKITFKRSPSRLAASGTQQVRAGGRTHQRTYKPYRPNETEHFEYMVKDYISDVYVPYDTIVDDVEASPYEIRWPGDRLRSFAVKAESSAWKKPVPKGKHVCFVSVGKAAGSSVSSLLGFQLHGPDVFFIPSGVLAHYTTHMFHGSVNDCADDMPYHLYTLRNPLSRAQSAFAYDRDTYKHDFEVIYDECGFKTLNMLAAEGLADDGRAPDHCKRLAYELIRGSGYMYDYHLFCNYHYYLNITLSQARNPKGSKILAIRSEHMEDDWNTAERVVASDNKNKHVHVDLNVPHLNSHDKKAGDTFLSEKSQVLLCDALCEEIQVYKRLLGEAVNLSKRDYAQSIAELQESCPLQASTDSCIS